MALWEWPYKYALAMQTGAPRHSGWWKMKKKKGFGFDLLILTYPVCIGY